MDIEDLIKIIIDSAVQVKVTLGNGFLESVYQNSLAIELESKGIQYKKEEPIAVYYKEKCVGYYRADLLVDNRVIVELKTASGIDKSHEYQLTNYLRATGIADGLIINFGTPRIEIKRKYLNFNKG